MAYYLTKNDEQIMASYRTMYKSVDKTDIGRKLRKLSVHS